VTKSAPRVQATPLVWRAQDPPGEHSEPPPPETGARTCPGESLSVVDAEQKVVNVRPKLLQLVAEGIQQNLCA